MLTPERKAALVEQVLAAVQGNKKLSHDEQTDVLSHLALDSNIKIKMASSAIARGYPLSQLIAVDAGDVYEAALLEHLETETLELTDLGRAEAARA